MPAAFRQACTLASAKGLARAARPPDALELADVLELAAAEVVVLEELLPPPQATTPAAVATMMPPTTAGLSNDRMSGPPPNVQYNRTTTGIGVAMVSAYRRTWR
jgi:hypothetical protein